MPSKSSAQHRFFEAVYHSKEFSKKTGVSQDVAKEFVDADKNKQFKPRSSKLYKDKS